MTLVLLKGKERCSAALGSIYIHVEKHDDKQSDFVEEMLLHEGGHASMDEKINKMPQWKIAQQKDSLAISKYASDNIDREDITESLIACLAVRDRSQRITVADSLKIVETMPARLVFFDSLKLNVLPLDTPTEFDYLYEVRGKEVSEVDFDSMMSFDEFIFKVGLVMLGIVLLLLLRYVIRNAGF